MVDEVSRTISQSPNAKEIDTWRERNEPSFLESLIHIFPFNYNLG